MGRRPRDLMDPSFHESGTADIHTNQTRLLNEDIQKLAVKTHLEAQQREAIRRDLALAEGMKFVLPGLKGTRTSVLLPRRSEQNSAGKWLKVEITFIFQVNASKLRRQLETVDLEEPPDSCEQTGAPVLLLSCEDQIDVWELFSDNSYLSAILDRQELMDAAPVDFRTKKASHHRHNKAFCQRLKCRIPR